MKCRLSTVSGPLVWLCVAQLTLVATLAGQEAAESVTSESQESEFLGWWIAEQSEGPRASGELKLDLSEQWIVVQIGEFGAKVERRWPNVEVDLEGGFLTRLGLGSLRAALDTESGEIRGHWIQPPSFAHNYPHATPIVLQPAGSSNRDTTQTYVGVVNPIADRLRFGLHVRRTLDGQLTVVLRNPELNRGRFMGWHQLNTSGDQVKILDSDGRVAARGVLAPTPGGKRLRLDVPQRGISFDFRRPEDESELAFVEPSLEKTPYEYRRPAAHDRKRDWSVAHASEVGMDSARLRDLVREIRATELESVYTPYLNAVVVARRGQLVLEETFHGHQWDEPHDTRSAGKSLASMLVGAAADRFEDFDEDTRYVDVYGSLINPTEASRGSATRKQRDAWREEMTIAHLLSMSSGLDCDDDDRDSVGNEGTMQDSPDSDWTAYALRLTMVRKPGSRALYCSNSINLAANAITHVAGRSLPDVFDEWIARPLGIDHYHFNLSPAGDGYMGGGIKLAPRDQAKLGQVMLDGGLWKGERILSGAWVESSTRARVGINEPQDYGFAWWRHVYEKDGEEIPAFYASGNGGQLTIVVPTYELVVQFSASNYASFGTWRNFRDDLVPRFILDAIDERP